MTKTRNNIRFDLSDYLIHFFRDVDLNSSSFIHLPEYCGFNNNHHSSIIDAKYLLRLSIRHYKLFASWSYRNGIRTIYGYDPAVCFTDMPISAYLQSGTERLSKSEKIGLYALALPKANMFSVGARPVIYALDGSSTITYQHGNGDERIIDDKLLPLVEQYRYVTYSPGVIDWTHEREWRWPYRCDVTEYLSEIKSYGIVGDIETLPCFDLQDVQLRECGVIVQFDADVTEIIHDILTLIDRDVAHKKTFKFIISVEKLNSFESILHPHELADHINSNLIILDDFFNIPSDVVKAYTREINGYIDGLYSNKDYFTDTYGSEFGNAWVWIHDNQNEVTRALIQDGLVSVNNEGKYLLKIDLKWSSWPLRKKEKFAKYVSDWLRNRFNLESCYFSVMGATDFNHIPSYNDDLDINHPYYNNTLEIDW
ncbi:DUF4427 domain-containing protein [Yersinia rohdei]|uniref:DUF4427 domain-containing protein n=1 Tax=Yersinia rohdei TaxID=29485 RepID=UPI0011AB0753|nr:DUF4427 domain-containing protein [Yersinia rohdei]